MQLDGYIFIDREGKPDVRTFGLTEDAAKLRAVNHVAGKFMISPKPDELQDAFSRLCEGLIRPVSLIIEAAIGDKPA